MFAAAGVYAQPNIFNPNDTIVNYNSANPPATPAANTMAKWVKTTTRITWWNTDKFKCYYWNGMAFRLRFPNGYNAADTTKKYPVILFLHGAGEIKGIYDNEDQLYWGAQSFQAKIDSGRYNAFLLFPQVSANAWDYTYYTRINSVLDSMQKYVKVDPDKVIAMGLSNGGFGAMSYAANFPQRVSTVIASSPALIQLIQGTIDNMIHVPTWVASGGLDSNPGPEVVNTYVDTFTAKGGDIRYSFYPTLGHGTWQQQWNEPYLVPYWINAHTANPLIFNKKNQVCENAVAAKLGITQGFAEYQWQVNGVNIANSNSNDIIGTQLGSYRVRFRRVAGGPWSDWSLVPAVITALPVSASPSISVTGIRSVVLPAPDGSTTTPLELPAGYTTYEWRRISDNALVSSARNYNAPVGQYKAKATNCNSTYSPVFTIITASGAPKPDSARNLTLTRVTSTSIRLTWTDVTSPVSNETGFEVYRAAKAGGPYIMAGITGADVKTFTDTAISNNYNFYYIIRAVNATGASGLSNENSLQPASDAVVPTTPANLKAVFTSRNYIDLEWIASTDNVGVTAYDVFISGVKKYTTTIPKISADGLLPNTSYTFTVVALDQAGNVSGVSNAVTATSTVNGLKYHYYEGNWNVLPNFSTLTEVASGTTPNVDIAVRPAGVNDYFSFVWEGFINIKTPGNYTFETVSDDGSKFYYNSFYSPTAIPLVNNDGLHGAISASGTVNISDVGLHPIAITFFEKNSGETMQVYWTGPGIARQLIPNSAFTESYQAPADVDAPTAPTGLTAVFLGNTSIDLSWTASTDNVGVSAYDIYVNGVKKYTSTTNTVTADSLVSNTTYSFTVIARDLAGNTSAASTALSAKTTATSAGLKYKFYQGSWSVLPDFITLTPVKTGTSANVDISVRTTGVNDNFGFVWEGYINLPAGGTYTFETVSDDGSKLYFNSLYSPTAAATVNNDGLHGAASVTRTVPVATAGYYPISITFFEKDGGETMQVYWTGPGIPRQLIPNSAFVSQLPADNVAPVAPTNVTAAATNSTFINLTWTASTDNVGVTGYDVYVNNTKKYSTSTNSVTADNLTAGTSYVFTVKALDFAGNASAFSTALTTSTSATTTGLTYKYYEGTWDLLPNFSALTPVKTGVTTNIDIVTTRNQSDNYGYLWEGNINLPTAGTYTFETISDDGSKFYFNKAYSPTATALVNNDGLHGTSSATGSVTVAAAGIYPIAITFFEKNGGEIMQVYWSGPGIPRQLIPNEAFTGAYTPPADAEAPSVPANVKAILTTNTYVDISWDNSTDNVGVTGYDVFVNGSLQSTVTSNFYRLTGLTAGQSNTFTIRARDLANNMSTFSTALTVVSTPKANGLKYRYYEGSWNTLPNFDLLTAVKTGSSATTDINVKPSTVTDNFGFVWEGYINITTPGTYTFETISDDGSKFYWNTLYNPAATALVNNDGLHGPTSVSGTVNIPTAGLYPISITFFEKDGGETMQVYYSGPGIARQLIPGTSFSSFTGGAPATQRSTALTTLQGATSDDAAINAKITSAYPNPFTESLNVQYTSTTAANNVSVGIYDMGGRLVQRQLFGNTAAGVNTLSIHLNKQMMPGMYLVKLDIDGKPVKMWKMMKEKK